MEVQVSGPHQVLIQEETLDLAASIRYQSAYDANQDLAPACLHAVCRAFLDAHAQEGVWVLCSMAPGWVKDSPLTRHRKPWLTTQEHPLLAKRVRAVHSSLLSANGLLACLSLFQAATEDLPALVEFALTDSRSGIFFLPLGQWDWEEISRLLVAGMVVPPPPTHGMRLPSLCRVVLGLGGTVLAPSGWFDFGEVALDVIQSRHHDTSRL